MSINAIAALKAQLNRERAKAKGLEMALAASKQSRDAFAARYWELRKAGATATATKRAWDDKYQLSYDGAMAHLKRFITAYADGDLLYYYVDPKVSKPRPMDFPIVTWKVIKGSDDQFELDFVEEILLVD